MSTEEYLEENEELAAESGFYNSGASLAKRETLITPMSGKKQRMKGKKTGKLKSLGVMGFLTAILVVIAVLFSTGNLIPSAISERLIEETDVQYADAVVSKELVFQQALKEGSIPEDTAGILKRKGILVGYLGEEGFVETTSHSGALSLMMDNKVISADEFINEVQSNIQLYNAFNEATYSRAAYYYDESAQKVFKQIGTNRNNYTGENEFDEVMDDLIGNGSDVEVNTVYLAEKTRVNEETGKTEVYYEYEETGSDASSNGVAGAFVSAVAGKNTAGSTEEATLNSADTLKVADTISKEQRSSLYYLAFMENISKMKAGEGNTSEINEAMNYVFRSAESEVVDINTGEIVKTTGTPMDAPSMYAVLSGNKVDVKDVNNYSSDRILKLTENKLGINGGSGVISNTVSSTTSKVKGSVGRYINNGAAVADSSVLGLTEPIVDSSLVNNSYETIKGIKAGEFLVEGAVNVGKELAKQSGASAGDADAVLAYTRLNNAVLAMDAKVDRMNRNPFDITSRNTFLGSIIYNLAITMNTGQKGTVVSGITGVMKTVGKAINGTMSSSYADASEGYLGTFGECETYATIGAVGSAGCAEIATFDTSTLNDPFNNNEFVAFVEANTTLNASGNRTINKGSVLADYILYNDERITPLGVTDGGILDSVSNGSNTISFTADILGMVKRFLGTPEGERKIATGAAFVNSSSNTDWQTYKYAQRYISLARATENLKRYTNDATAYNNLMYFEGDENPVVAFLNDYYQVANR